MKGSDFKLISHRGRLAFIICPEQLKVLTVKPGITDYASLLFFEESELLSKSDNPEKTYTEEIMPQKLALNLQYIRQRNFMMDLNIILKTVRRIFS